MVSYSVFDKVNVELKKVLILIVVEDGLVLLIFPTIKEMKDRVLILIVVEDGLVLDLIRLF